MPRAQVNLTAAQQEAVEYINGPLLIVAGAGTGKTHVITEKIAYLIEEKGCSPDQILALTFTDNAANEMYTRAYERLAFGTVEPKICTFHVFAQELIQDFGIEIGLSNKFTLQSKTASWLLMRDVLQQEKLTYYKPLGDPFGHITDILNLISQAKDDLIDPEQFIAQVENLRLNADDNTNEEIERLTELGHIYHVYQKEMLTKGHLDFGDLLLYANRILSSVPKALRAMRELYAYVLVDEFQDVNTSQYEFTKLLVGDGTTVMLTVVGDDDQAIYTFRGSKVEHMLNVTTDFPGTHTVVLTDNFRSGQALLDASYRMIHHNDPERLEIKLSIEKKLRSQVKQAGNISYSIFDSAAQEAQAVAHRIEMLHAQGVAYKDIAILSRAHMHTDACVALLKELCIPCDRSSHDALLNTPIVLDMLALLHLVQHEQDGVALYRVLCMPHFAMSGEDIRALTSAAKEQGTSLFHVCVNHTLVPSLQQETRKTLDTIIRVVRLLSQEQKRMLPSQLAYKSLEEIGALAFILKQIESGDIDSAAAVEHMRAFLSFVGECEQSMLLPSVYSILQHFDLLLLAHDEKAQHDTSMAIDAVRIMAVHGAKGLEFHTVFLVSASSDRFPGKNMQSSLRLPNQAFEVKQDRKSYIIEERRLMYVALTRATHNCFISVARYYSEEGKREKKISPFILEADISEVPYSAESGFSAQPSEKKAVQLFENSSTKPETISLSFSSFRSYNTCPYQYNIRHILGVPDKPSASASFGTSVHSVLQKIGARLQEQTGMQQPDLFGSEKTDHTLGVSEKDALTLLDLSWVSRGYDSKEDQELHKEDAERRVRAWVSYAQAHGWQAPLRMEKTFSLHIGATKISGRIDCILPCSDGSIELIDYKTGKPKEKLSWDDKQQLLVYQLASERLDDFKVLGRASLLSYCYITDEGPVRQSFLGTQDDLDQLAEEIENTANCIEARDFHATPSKRVCGSCPFRTICQFRIM